MKKIILNLFMIGMLFLFAVDVKAEEVTLPIPAPEAGAKVYQSHSVGNCDETCDYYEVTWDNEDANISEQIVYFDVETIYSGYVSLATKTNNTVNYVTCNAEDTYVIDGATTVTCLTSGNYSGSLRVVFDETSDEPIAATQMGASVAISAPITMGKNGPATFHLEGSHYDAVGIYRDEETGISVKANRDFETGKLYSAVIDFVPDTGYTCFGLTGDDMEFPNIPEQYIQSVEKDRNKCAVTVSFAPFYTIETVAQNGTITIASKAVAMEELEYQVTANSPYELDTLTVYDEDDNDITDMVLVDDVLVMPDINIRIEATFIKDSYTVTFHTNGGNEIASIEVSSHDENTFEDILPDDPTKTGYEFNDWYIDEGLHTALTRSDLIDQDYDLYAQWVIPFSMMCYDVTTNEPEGNAGGTIHYVTSDGLSHNPTNAGGVIFDGDSVTYTAVPNQGYRFVGITRDTVNGEITSTNPEILVTYTLEAGGQYNLLFERVFEVSFDTMGGQPMNSQFVKEGNTLLPVADAVREGYVFNGWYTSNTYETAFDFDTPITQNITLYAKWLEIVTTVDAHINLPVASKTADMNPTVNSNKYTVTFDSWYLNEEGYPHLTETDTFEFEKNYTIRVVFTPATGYTFTDDTVFTINGEATESFGSIAHRQKSYTVTEVPDLVAPTVTIAKGSNNSLVLSWNEQVGAVSHDIYRSTDNKKWSKVATVTETTYTNTGLTYGKVYYYRVRSCTATKCFSFSTSAYKMVRPNDVENFTAPAVSVAAIKLSWDKVAVTGYQIQRKNGSKWVTIKTITNNNTTSFVNTKLSSNKTYNYRIRAYKTVGRTKVYSGYWTYLTAKTTPAIPAGKLYMRNYQEVGIVIGKVTGATHYIVEKSLDGTTFEELANLPEPGTFADAGLTTGTKYYYRIKACNGDLCSPWRGGYIVASTVVPSFALKTASKKVAITVTPVEGATGYVVYRSTKANSGYKRVGILTTAEDVYTLINSTKKGRTYYYRVRAYVELENETVYSALSGYKKIRSK